MIDKKVDFCQDIHVNCLKNMLARNAGMKWIRGDILPNTITEDPEVAFKLERWRHENVRAQNQKLFPNISKLEFLRYFEGK